MTSARSLSQSTILPFPSSPHWAPTTTTFAMMILLHDAAGQNPAPYSECSRWGKPQTRACGKLDKRAALGDASDGLFDSLGGARCLGLSCAGQWPLACWRPHSTPRNGITPAGPA